MGSGKSAAKKAAGAADDANAMARQAYEDYMKQWQEAKTQNEARYGTALGLQDDLYGRTMDMVSKLSDQELTDVKQRYAVLGNQANAALTSRGMGGTTVMPSVQRGITREGTADINRTQDSLARMKAGYDIDLTNQKVGTVTGRTDAYPNYSVVSGSQQMAAQMAQQAQQLASQQSGWFGNLLGAGSKFFFPGGVNLPDIFNWW